MENGAINEEELLPKKKPFFSYTILFLVTFNICLIIYIFLIIYYINKKNNDNSNSPNQNNTNPTNSTGETDNINSIISQITDNYLLYLNKLAITEKRLNHLFNGKNTIKDNYNNLIQLEKSIFKKSWEYLQINNKETIIKLNEMISIFLSLPKNEKNNNISNILFQIMIESESISNLKDNDNIKYIIKKLENKEENEEIKNKLNIILLYSYINLPLQFGYFSSNQTIKNNFINEIYNHMISSNKNILTDINKNMGQYSNDSIYMALGTTQNNEYRGITSKSPEIPYINICNTGLRTQYYAEEEQYLKDNIQNYFIKPEYKNIIMECTGNEIMKEDTYENFVIDCFNLLENLSIDNAIQVFSKYDFSIETANTFIEYLKLNVPLENIIIIRLGEKNNKNKYEDLKYNKNKVYILFNVIDVAQTYYKNIEIIRATTEANVKAIYYLMNECPNFLNKEEYNNIVLISRQLNAERQLEAFNIISNIFNYGIEFNSVIWNKNYESVLTDKQIYDYILNIIVKSYNLIASSLKQYYINEYDKNKNANLLINNNFIKEIMELTDKIKII